MTYANLYRGILGYLGAPRYYAIHYLGGGKGSPNHCAILYDALG